MKTKYKTNYRYDVVDKNGNKQPWTGTFKTPAEADAWYDVHGRWWESEGREIVRVEHTYEDKS